MNREEFNEKLIQKLNELSHNRFELREVAGEKEILLDLGQIRIMVNERVYDKYHNKFVKYESRDEVQYRDVDVDIAVNNIRYVLMEEFDKIVFPRKG